MGRPIGPRKIHRYSVEFKLTAVKLSDMPGVQVQTVAAALDIHPFMLSRWRKDARDGILRGRARRGAVEGRRAREIKRPQALEREHAMLQEEHELLKKAIRYRDLHVHRQPARALRVEADVRAVRRDARRVLRVAGPGRERPPGTGPGIAAQDPLGVRTQSRDVWQPADSAGARHRRRARESTTRRAAHARGRPAGAGGQALSAYSRPARVLSPT